MYKRQEKNNPLSPKRLSTNFSNASKILSIDIKARIVIFKHFEKAVLAKLSELYKQANEKLIRAGVLVNYSGRNQSAQRAAQVAHSTRTGTQGELHTRQVRSQSTQELSQLLNFMPEHQGGLHSLWTDTGAEQMQAAGLSNELVGAIQSLASNVGPMISGDNLMGVLDNLQHDRNLYPRLTSSDTGAIALQSPQHVLSSINSALLATNQSGGYSLCLLYTSDAADEE